MIDVNYIIDKIFHFTKLEENWDGYGAIPLCVEVYENAKVILTKINTTPSDVYPNPHGTLGVEYENDDNFLRIEIGIKAMTYSTPFISKDSVEINEETIAELNKFLMFVMLKK